MKMSYTINMTNETNVSNEEQQAENDFLENPSPMEKTKPHFIADAISKLENKKILFSALAVVILGGSIIASRALYIVEQPQATTTPPVALTTTDTSVNSLTPEDSVEHEKVSSSTFSESEARIIAESVCIKGGETLGVGKYNDGTKTWWYDANLNTTQEGCKPACVVDEVSQTAEINWRCTGLVIPTDKTPTSSEENPVACTADAKICPDGSAVGRTPPDCEFAPCPISPESDENTVPPPDPLPVPSTP